MRSLPGWVLIFVMAGVPVAAQEPEAPRVFFDGTAFLSVERTGQLRYEPPLVGGRDADATVGGGGFAVGTFLTPRVSLRLEGAFPQSVDSNYSTRSGPIYYASVTDLSFSSGFVEGGQFLSSRAEDSISRRSAAVLLGYHTARRSRVRLGYLGGVAFLWERQRSVVEQAFPAIVPLIPVRIQRYDVTTTTYRPAVALGFDADVALARQVSVVPQLRVQAVAGMLSLRPGIAVRWTP